jgi:2-polyprenyl-3-methyl-5-hydroxy-6-metoxy-1,4-benzoquinol methylase
MMVHGRKEMSEFDPEKYKAMVKRYQDNDDPLGWFDSIYTDAEGDYKRVFWADLEPGPYLLEWLEKSSSLQGKKAIAVGCGVGDDAEALSFAGYEVTAFDISPEAIRLCKNRYPDSKVNYLVEDLFNYPKEWAESFDLVYECNTIQVLPGKYRVQARNAMISLMAKDAHLLVSCRSRLKGQQENDIPLPLDKDEIDGFKNCGLSEESFLSYDDTQTPNVPHFFACYKKSF